MDRTTLERLKMLRNWLEEKEEYFFIGGFDAFDFMFAIDNAVYYIEDIRKKEERTKLMEELWRFLKVGNSYRNSDAKKKIVEKIVEEIKKLSREENK